MVRKKVKMFAQRKVTLPAGRHKIIILDEADSMTEGAQQALRRTMELCSNTTRFALACNTSSKIIEPIQSRCAVVRFQRLTAPQILARLKVVAEAEHMTYTPDGLDAILFSADGDMRQALNNLQSTWAGFGHVTGDNVYKVCDSPHPLVVHKLVRHCLQGELHEAEALLGALWSSGYSAADIVQTVFRVVKTAECAEVLKLSFLREVGTTHMRVVDGLGTIVQLSGLVATLCALATSPNAAGVGGIAAAGGASAR